MDSFALYLTPSHGAIEVYDQAAHALGFPELCNQKLPHRQAFCSSGAGVCVGIGSAARHGAVATQNRREI
jgi:hypothetical protein